MYKESPIYIVADSTVFISDYYLRSNTYDFFSEKCASGKFKLFVPQVVIDEVLNHRRKDAEECKSSLKKAYKDVNKYFLNAPTNPIDDNYLLLAYEEYSSYFYQQLKELKTTILPYPKITHEDMVKKALAARKPFTNDGKIGYRDALIWSNIVELLSVKSEIIFLTANSSDFAHNDELHGHLKEELTSIGVPENSVILIKDLRTLEQLYAKGEYRLLEDVKDEINEDRFSNFSLWKFIDNELAEYLQGIDLISYYSIEPELEEAFFIGFENIFDAEVEEVRNSKPDILIINIRIEGECRFEGSFLTENIDYMDPYFFQYNEIDFDRKFQKVTFNRQVSMFVEVVLNEKTKEIKIEYAGQFEISKERHFSIK
jgi:hypothetical protein